MLEKNIVKWTNRYVRLGNICIIVDVDETITEFLGQIHDTSSMNFHLFISKMSSVDNLIPFIEILRNSMKLTIHIPKHLEDIGVLIRNMIKDLPYCKVIVERKGPRFRVPGHWSRQTWIVVTYSDEGIFLDLRLLHSIYEGYNINTFAPLSSGVTKVISNTVRLTHPSLFKDAIIKAFKEVTPDGILTSFKNDEEIWEYILMQGEWTVQDCKPRISYTNKMINAVKPPFNSVLSKEDSINGKITED